jgi:4a-hydroxytetrahydrobiopterin dehydratase
MKLSSEQIADRLKSFTGWEYQETAITKLYRFPDFIKAIEYVNKLAIIAESQDHHPDIGIHYNQVTLSLTTHDAGGVTDKDFILAKAAEKLAVEHLI